MAATAGYSNVLSISTDDSTYNALGGIKSFSSPFSADELDTTAFGTGQWRTSIQGLKSAEWSLDGDFVSETAQNAIRTAFNSGATIYIKALYDGTNGWKQAVKVFNYEPGAAVDGLVSFTATLKAQAAPTALP